MYVSPHIYIHASYIHIHTYIHTYINTYTHTIHTYIHTDRQTDIHTYIGTHAKNFRLLRTMHNSQSRVT